jgi:hypothetical protein
MIDTRLKEWATPRQCEYIDKVNELGNQKKAAKFFGVVPQVVCNAVKVVKRKAARAGYAPEADMHRATVAPFVVKGTSTLYDKDGNMAAQWVKTTVDREQVEQAVRAAVDALMLEVPRVAPLPAPKSTLADLCNLYTITDYHVGMRAWAPETGEDWDLDIAERVLLSAFTHAVKHSPKAGTAFVNQLGDFLHFDSLSPITPMSGHLLDADSRYAKVIQVATRLLRRIITMALETHEQVVVLLAEGNHDTASSVWLRHLFGLLYENEPRVKVIDSELPYYAHQHGKTMLAFHHGHLAKNAQLPLLFAARFPEVWGTSTKRYVHVGHWHHVEEKEHAGMKVVQHATLAAADAYASRHGYLSQRELTVITYHKQFGQVARTTVCPEMFE